MKTQSCKLILIFLSSYLIVANWAVGTGWEIFGADLPWRSEFLHANFEVVSQHFGIDALMAPHYSRVIVTSFSQVFCYFFSPTNSTIVLFSLMIATSWSLSSSIFLDFLDKENLFCKLFSVFMGFIFTFGPIGFFYFIRLQNNFFFPLAVLAGIALILKIYRYEAIPTKEKIRWIFICLLNIPITYQPPLVLAAGVVLLPFILTKKGDQIAKLLIYGTPLLAVCIPGALVSYIFGINNGSSEFSSHELANWVSNSTSLVFVIPNIADIGWHEGYFPAWESIIQPPILWVVFVSSLFCLLAIPFCYPENEIRLRIIISLLLAIFFSTGTHYFSFYSALIDNTFFWAIRAPWQKFFVFAECWYLVTLCYLFKGITEGSFNDRRHWFRRANR